MGKVALKPSVLLDKGGGGGGMAKKNEWHHRQFTMYGGILKRTTNVTIRAAIVSHTKTNKRYIGKVPNSWLTASVLFL